MQEKESEGGSLVAHHGVVEDPVFAVGTLDVALWPGAVNWSFSARIGLLGSHVYGAEWVIRARDYDRVVGIVAAAGVA